MRCLLVARPASSAAAWSGRRHTKAARALASSHPPRRSCPSRSHRPCHPRRRSHRRRNRRRRRSVSGPSRRPTAQSLRSAQAPAQTKQRSSQAHRARRRARWGGEGTGGICWLAVLMTLMSGRACEPSPGTWSRGPWEAREGQGVPARPPAHLGPNPTRPVRTPAHPGARKGTGHRSAREPTRKGDSWGSPAGVLGLFVHFKGGKTRLVPREPGQRRPRQGLRLWPVDAGRGGELETRSFHRLPAIGALRARRRRTGRRPATPAVCGFCKSPFLWRRRPYCALSPPALY